MSESVSLCLEIFHFSTFYFLRYGQVKNQKGVKMFVYKYEYNININNYNYKYK